MHFVADADADKNYFGIKFLLADAETAVLCSLEGGSIADKYILDIIFRA